MPIEMPSKMQSLKDLVRPNIWALEPYSCARDEFKGRDAHVFLDANESPYNTPRNRYPDPLQEKLKIRLAQVKGVPAENIFLGIPKTCQMLANFETVLIIANVVKNYYN